MKGDLRARFAKDGEKVLALDGKTYTLDSKMVVIADDAAAHDIAGVMGGEDRPAPRPPGMCSSNRRCSIRSASRGPVGCSGSLSDARYRFERGVDPEFTVPGLELATKMILEFCGGEASEVVVAGGVPHWRRTIEFDPARVKKLGGLDIAKAEMIAILGRLGFQVEDGATLRVVPPSWRGDIEGPADLVEEIVRIHGLNAVPSAAMERPSAIAKPTLTPGQQRTRIVRRTLAAAVSTRRSTTPSSRARMPDCSVAATMHGRSKIRSPPTRMRCGRGALPSLLAAAQRNVARGFDDLLLFEIGAQFESGMPGAQMTVAAGIRVGSGARNWTKATHPADVFDAKADMLAAIEAAMGGTMTAPVKAGAPSWYHPGRSGTLALGPKTLALFGEVHPRILAAFDLKGPVAAFEVFLEAIPEAKAKPTRRGLCSRPRHSSRWSVISPLWWTRRPRPTMCCGRQGAPNAI